MGASSYMALVGAAQGLVRQFAELARFCGADIVVQQAAATSPWSSILSPGQVAALARVEGVQAASRVGLGKAKLFGAPYFLVFGVDPDEDLIRALPLAAGRSLRGGEAGILLGEVAAERLKLSLGQPLEVRGTWLDTAGIYRTGHPVLDAGAVLDLGLVQRLFNLHDAVNVVFLRLADPARRAEALRAIASGSPGVEANAADTWLLSFNQLGVVRTFARTLALLAVLIAALGASNVLHLSVAERTGEIAVLRALGWRRRRIAALVLGDGAALAGAGGLCGVPLAMAMLWLVGVGPLHTLNSAGLITPRLPATAALEGVAVTLLAGLAGSVPPLLRALRVEPALALRLP